MELKEFIKQTLVQISTAIEDANIELESTDAIINPRTISVNSESMQSYAELVKRETSPVVELVDFDIAVSVADSTDSKAAAGIFVNVIAVGGQSGEASSRASESRIKFKVPVVWPSSDKFTRKSGYEDPIPGIVTGL